MLLGALKAEARISHVPISLRPDAADRRPHLRTWRDGMRHLLQILLEAPHLFQFVGLSLFLFSWAVLLTGWRIGPVKVGFASVLGIHTLMFAMLGSCFALSLWSIGLLLSVRARAPLRTYRALLELGEGQLFWSAVLFMAISCGFFVTIVTRWALGGFENLALEQETLLLTTFGANGVLLVVSVLTAHLLKQMRVGGRA
jgi:hypothetical protein